MAKVYRCRDVDVSDMSTVPLFAGCDFECRGETNEEVLKIAVEHVRAAHSQPLEKLLGAVFKEGESQGTPAPQEKVDIPEGPARVIADFFGRITQAITSGSAKRVLIDQAFPLILLPKLREAISDES
jgi:hypothetical protein